MTARKTILVLLATIPLLLFLIANLVQAGLTPRTLGSLLQPISSGFVNYQGVLTDSAGNPLPDGNRNVTFLLFNMATGGVPLWSETQSVATHDGLFNAYLGSVTPLNPDQIDGRDLWLAVKVEADPEMRPRMPIASVFYARSFIPGAVVRGDLPIDSILSIINTGRAGTALHLESPLNGRALDAEGEIRSTRDIISERNIESQGSISANGSMQAGGLNISGSSRFGGNASFDSNVSIEGTMSAGGCNCPGLFTQGNLTVGGMTSTVVGTESFGQRHIFALAGAEVWLVDQGQGQLEKGVAIMALDPVFTEMVTIDTENPLLVQITLTSDSKGVFVAEKSATGFTVRELHGGTSNATFDWQVSARRKGYETQRLNHVETPAFTPVLPPAPAGQ